MTTLDHHHRSSASVRLPPLGRGVRVVRTAACSCTRVIYGKAPPPLCVPAAGPCTWTLSHCLSPLSPVSRHCQETLQLQHGLTAKWMVLAVRETNIKQTFWRQISAPAAYLLAYL